MVVYNFNVIRIVLICPDKANSPLSIDANTMLALAIANQFL